MPVLLERLAQVEDLHWVRFLYCYPNRITPRLLETIAAHTRLAKYLDIPLQHASRNVLAKMKRGSHGGAFLKMLEKVRATIPGVSIRTSFIVGFPGETEQDFQELCDFVKAAEFDWMGVFEYSDEDAAKSFALGDKVDAETIARRKDELMRIQKRIVRSKLRKKLHQRIEVMLEGPSKETDLIWEARTRRHGARNRRQSVHHRVCGRERRGRIASARHIGYDRSHQREGLRLDRARRGIHARHGTVRPRSRTFPPSNLFPILTSR